MKGKDRQTLLKIVAIACVGLLLLNWLVIGPVTSRWTEQSKRIDTLSQQVARGNELLKHAPSIRSRWAEMQRTDLPDEVSTAENDAYKAIGRWARDSRVTFTNLTPQWRNHEEGYDTLDCRASANGDQISLSRFLYELEVDPMPVALQECEITSRDAQGQQLMMNVRFSFVRLAKTTIPSTAVGGGRAPARR